MRYRLDQSNSATGNSHANLTVPGCGLNEQEGEAPILYVSNINGHLTLHVFADINSKEATHAIDLSKALLTNREARPASTPDVPAGDEENPPEQERRVRRRR